MPPCMDLSPPSNPRKSVDDPFVFVKEASEEEVFQLPPTCRLKVFSCGMLFVLIMMNPPE